MWGGAVGGCFPAIARLVRNREVFECLKKEGDGVVWDSGIRREVNDWELDELLGSFEL